MKVFRFLLWTFLLVLAAQVHAQEMSPAAKSFKTNIATFLREEGYVPTTEANSNAVEFKREGETYKIIFSGSRPVQVTMYIDGFSNKDANMLALLLACNEVNKSMYYVKTYITDFGDDDRTMISIEIPAHTEEDFRYVFSDCIRSLAQAKNELKDEYDKNQKDLETSSVPFKITKCSVGNEEQNGNMITPYGNKIYSYNTKYLRPQVEIQSEQAGIFDINYKLFMPDGTMSTGTTSPSGYTTGSKISISQGTYTYKLQGWGSNTAGNWKAGNYRYEFYCEGTSLGYYEFTIY